MGLHGVPRTTMDVDIIIAMDDVNIDSFISAANRLELSPVMPVPLTDLKDKIKREGWIKEKNMIVLALRSVDPSSPTIDVLIEPTINVDVALERAKRVEAEGVPVQLAAIEDMIELKKEAGRAQDISDIKILEELLEK